MKNAKTWKRGSSIFTFTLLWLLVGMESIAQRPEPSFEHFTTDQGLVGDLILAILKDRRGFLWVGTSNGLSRFDGQHFKNYRRQPNDNSLRGNYVVNAGLTEDTKGFLWVATNKGLHRFDPIREEFKLIPLPTQRDGQADNDYTSPVHFDRTGYGWFSSKFRLYRIDPHTLRLKAFVLPAVSDNAYADPYLDHAGRLWINHAGKIYRHDFRSGRFTRYFAWRNGQADSTVQFGNFKQTGSSALLSSSNRGLWRYDDSNNHFVADSALPSKPIYALQADTLAGKVPFWWLWDADNGLAAYVPTTREYFVFEQNPYDQMSHNGGAAMAFYRDSETGIMWIGTDRGLEKIDPNAIKFRRKLLPQTINEGQTKFVAMVRPDIRQPEQYWLAVRGAGLLCWKRTSDEFVPITFGSEKGKADAHNVIQDGRGRVWVGLQRGVGRYDPLTGKREFLDSFLPETTRHKQSITVTFRDRQGRIWLGSNLNGLYRYEPKRDRIEPWPLAISTELGFIRRIQQDSQGQVWVLTGAGLFCLDPVRGTTRPVKLHGAPIEPTDRLHSTFSLDSQDQIWMSGIGYVAVADRTGRISRTYTLANGLRAEHVFGIQEDRRGHIWMVSDDQLHELNPHSQTFTYYGKDSGLLEEGIFHPTELTLDPQGELFIGFRGGFNYVQPDNLRPNPIPPPVTITGLRIDNQARSLATPLDLQPGETTLNIDFAALTFSQPKKSHYAYKLDGFNTDWVYSNDATATYTNLAPGHYTFRVKAANNDGLWNETGTSLYFRVIPAFWQTWWFRLLAVLVGVLLLYAVYRYRERQRQHLESIRNRIATDLHDDMGSTLSSIRIFSDVAQQQIADVRPETVPVLQRISSSATALSESMQDIIWTIQSKDDSLADLATRMREFGLRMAEAKGVDFQMQVGESFTDLRLNVEQRRNIYLIFKETINNAIKYANASRIEIKLATVGRELRLLIQDNGCGFDIATTGPGNGLPNLRKRAAEIRGQFSLTSEPGQGTEVSLRMKV
ncbi:ligand-binding sensor domain-containing protein [Salmonirosea aquatica]|uniref:Histidine kinase domain-containing protein n=1 Tax=Salmonirosea aquatica TaxID=2654236 RepID=A0A7C9BFZ9_9BACT|nr:hypothetical protein [Cytophagaceae bacterium SJW1-29]